MMVLIDEEEKQALKDIYSIYQSTASGESIPCGCGPPAQIAYQGHISSCQYFQLILDRKPYKEILQGLKTVIMDKSKPPAMDISTDKTL